MRVPTRPRKLGLRFNITPLIDVVFLLIIFFLVASHFVRSEAREPVDLPEATADEDRPKEAPRRLIVTVKPDETLSVGGQVVTLQTVEQMILAGRTEGAGKRIRGGFEVRIRADRSVPYRAVEPILLAAARSGVTDVKFAVIER